MAKVKLSKNTKMTILSFVCALVCLTGGIAIGCNAEKIYDSVGDAFGYEHVIEDKDETKDDTAGDETVDDTTGEEDSGSAE